MSCPFMQVRRALQVPLAQNFASELQMSCPFMQVRRTLKGGKFWIDRSGCPVAKILAYKKGTWIFANPASIRD